jgi:hypothetical protein
MSILKSRGHDHLQYMRSRARVSEDAAVPPRIIAVRARLEARRRHTMALETQERIRPVTGTHVVRVQHEGIVTAGADPSKDFLPARPLQDHRL